MHEEKNIGRRGTAVLCPATSLPTIKEQLNLIIKNQLISKV